MENRKCYKAIVFDLFGTLVPPFSSRTHDLVLREMSQVLGVQEDAFAKLFDEDMRHEREAGKYRTIEENIEQTCNMLGANPDPSSINKAAQFRYDFTAQSLQPRKDAIQTLRRIKGKGYGLGLISDCSPEVPVLWSTTPYADLIDVAIFSSQEGIKKPDRRIYQCLCDKLAASPTDCLYIGDGDSFELEGAIEIGMDAILIRIESEEGCDRDRPSAMAWTGKRINQLSELLEYI